MKRIVINSKGRKGHTKAQRFHNITSLFSQFAKKYLSQITDFLNNHFPLHFTNLAILRAQINCEFIKRLKSQLAISNKSSLAHQRAKDQLKTIWTPNHRQNRRSFSMRGFHMLNAFARQSYFPTGNCALICR